ncbi:DNA ligase, partial [Listeria marthii FSL S4-120]
DYSIEVRGEAFMPKRSFQKLNIYFISRFIHVFFIF